MEKETAVNTDPEKDLPPRHLTWDNGKYRGYTDKEAGKVPLSEWIPRFGIVGDSDQGNAWECSLPFRHISCQAETKELAWASLTRAYAELARNGSLDPDRPYMMGLPPLQHVLFLLGERLAFETEQRCFEILNHEEKKGTPVPGTHEYHPSLNRRNEIISGLATAIAALARVKEM